MFWYCGKVSSILLHASRMLTEPRKACQTTGWTVESHKAHCKFLKYPDVQILFHLNWDRFDNFVEFPQVGGGSHSGSHTVHPMDGGCTMS